MTYVPQIDDLKFTLDDIAGFGALIDGGAFPELSRDLIEAVLGEAGRFAQDVVAPLNRAGDKAAVRLQADGAVETAPGWKEAYAQWVAGGWGALPCDPVYGGQGLPTSIALAVQELWNTAASAFGIGTLLTQGAVEAVHTHGSEALRATYLAKMSAGEWTGTMNLTEPQAGSDLGALWTRAQRQGDGSYRIAGTKIFITYGEHDLTANIVHLVIARLEDAPAGTRGISLFLVPKFLVGADGRLGPRNDVKCIGVEHKLGIHGSPTCTLAFGEKEGAVGYLIGEENRGLACMFTMMNSARLHVGMQGVAIAERASQQALAFARERRQGRRPGQADMVAIIEHPDVRRMLLDMKAKTLAARAICFMTARALDLARHAKDEGERKRQDLLAWLLTPVAKAYGTDVGVEVASTGVQVHGGMGYIEETGAAQHYRDARITPIYEGTNGIQAIDLVTRKLTLGDGAVVKAFLGELKAIAKAIQTSNDPALGATGRRVEEAIADLETATGWMLEALGRDPDAALASATPYLRLFGLAAGGAFLAKGALAAAKRANGGTGADALRVRLARHYAENHMPETRSLSGIVAGGAEVVARTAPAMLAG